MRIVFLLFYCLFFFQAGFAQKLLLSEREEINLTNDDFSVIGNVSDRLAVYKKSKSEVSVIFYDTNMIKRKELPIPFIDKNFSAIYFSGSDENLVAFFQQRENKKENIYVTKLENNDTWSEPLLLNSISTQGIRGRIEYKVVLSENKNYELIYATYPSDKDFVVQAILLDHKLKELYRINQLVGRENWEVLSNAAVSNTGMTYMLAIEKPSGHGGIDEAALMVAKQGANEFTQMPLALNKYSISDLHFTIDNVHTMCFLAGFYSDGKYGSPKGLYFSHVKEGQQGEIESHFTPISLSVTKSRNDLRDFRIRNVSLKDDGGIEIIAEKFQQNIRTIVTSSPMMMNGFVTSPATSRTVTDFSYSELVTFNLKADGAMVWSQTMLKDQETTDDDGIFSSVGVLEHHLGKVIFFNDVNSKQPRLMSCYIAKNAELSMKEMQTNELIDEWTWMPRSLKQISKSEIVMPCVMKNYLCFLKISY